MRLVDYHDRVVRNILFADQCLDRADLYQAVGVVAVVLTLHDREVSAELLQGCACLRYELNAVAYKESTLATLSCLHKYPTSHQCLPESTGCA